MIADTLTWLESPWDDNDPLARIDKETDDQQTALWDYYNQEKPRSLARLAKQYQASTEPVPTKHESRLKIWSSKNHWQARIAVMAQLKGQAEADEREAKRAERRIELEESNWRRGDRLAAIAETLTHMLGQYITGGKDGKPKTWADVEGEISLTQVVAAAKVGAELMAQAVADNIDPESELTGAALDALIEREFARQLEITKHEGEI